MSILLRNRITGITTSTDLFGEDLALFLREYPDLVKVGIGTTTNQPYYILLNETTEEFRSPYVNNGLSYNPSTGTLSAGVFSGNGSGLSNVTAIYATIAGIATNVTTNANLTGHVTSVGNAAVLGSFTSLQLLTALTDETGSGANVFATSPTLVTPVLGTPSSGNLANCTFPTLNQNTTGSSASCTGNAATATVLQTARTINGVSFDGSANISVAEFASSTTIIFYQASAPTGWTKSTSHDNKALRVVSGTGGGSGGSSSFTSVFASRGVPLPEHNHSASSGNHDGHQHSGPTSSQSINHDHPFTTGFPNTNHTHTITTGNQSANHTHTFTTNSVGDHQHSINQYSSGNEAGGYGMDPAGGFQDRVKVGSPASDNTNFAGGHDHSGTTAGMSADHNHSGTTSGVSESHYHGGTTGGGGGSHSHDFTTQSGGSHNHSITVNNNGTAGASMDFAVQYIDVIICSKN